MANTIPDVKLNGGGYQNIYDLTGIPVGTSVIIQNKQYNAVYIQIADVQPSKDSSDGYMLIGNESCIVEGTISNLWAFGVSKICVQVVEG